MAFIRLAGCTVGKPYPKHRYKEEPHCEFKCEGGDPDLGHGPSCTYVKSVREWFPIYTEECTLYDGRKFPCDTDYRVKERLTIEQIFDRVPSGMHHVCITGGEPFMRSLDEFYFASPKETMLHVETSGTIPYEKTFTYERESSTKIWVTVSPKFGVLPSMVKRADEIKLLIDDKFDINKVPVEILAHNLVYIQPVNDENTIRPENVKRVMELQQHFPNWRVSLQLHKVLSQYMEELVR